MMANDSTAELMALLEMRVEVGHECKEEVQPVGGPIHDVVYYVQDLRAYYKCIKVDYGLKTVLKLDQHLFTSS